MSSRAVKPHRIRVLCVDDHPVMREGLQLILGTYPDIEIVGLAASGEDAVRMFRHQRPDVTLMDLQLPGMSGLDAIAAIRGEHADAQIVVLTMYEGDEDIHRSLKAGAVTYLLKGVESAELVEVIRGVHSGKRPMDDRVRSRLAERASYAALTDREVRVMELIAEGMRNKDVAAELGISAETVTVHLRNIFEKLDVSDRTGAVNVALRRGIIHIGPS